MRNALMWSAQGFFSNHHKKKRLIVRVFIINTKGQYNPLFSNDECNYMERKLVQAVALTIRYFRKLANISQEALAEKANLDRTYISGIERGVRNITLDSLEQIINALNVDVQTFFTKVSEEFNVLSN